MTRTYQLILMWEIPDWRKKKGLDVWMSVVHFTLQTPKHTWGTSSHLAIKTPKFNDTTRRDFPPANQMVYFSTRPISFKVGGSPVLLLGHVPDDLAWLSQWNRAVEFHWRGHTQEALPTLFLLDRGAVTQLPELALLYCSLESSRLRSEHSSARTSI